MNMPDNNIQVVQNTRSILGITVAALGAIFLLTYISGFNIPCSFVAYCLMALLPFLLVRMAPKAADFDRQWLPNVRTQWAWFLGMVLLVFVCFFLYKAMWIIFGFKNQPSFHPYVGIYTKTKVVLFGFIAILAAPIAEEIFFRGYLLEQLRKLTNSSNALLIQAFFFACAHLFYRGIYVSSSMFLFSLIVGSWRIRFRSILPIIIAHIVMNTVGGFHILKDAYHFAAVMSQYGIQLDVEKPGCLQILSLTYEPLKKAVPSIIAYFSDPDNDVRMFAQSILISKYRNDAEPYIKEALASKDINTINGALVVIAENHYSDLKQKIRDIAWSAEDMKIQISAVIGLSWLNDEEGLHKIREKHPNEKVRHKAEQMLNLMKEEDQKP
jgi:membrane protease YdiL (CAAX protease family)